MKKFLGLLLAGVMALSLAGCGGDDKAEGLVDYINTDIQEAVDIEVEMLESYRSVTGENYTDDLTSYDEIVNNTIVLARELNDELTELSGEIEDEAILEVHKDYMAYASEYLSALGLMISALENQDYAQMSEANEKISNANMYSLEFQSGIKALAEEYGVELNS